MNAQKHSRGVTLIELTSTLAAATLVLTLGVPAFRGLQSDIRVSQVRTDLIASFALARSEAIRRGAPVRLCPSVNGSVCLSGPATDWSTGWIVAGPEGQVLERVRFTGAPFVLTVEQSLASGVTFTSLGIPSATGALTYSDETHTCALQLLNIGRLELIPRDNQCQ